MGPKTRSKTKSKTTSKRASTRKRKQEEDVDVSEEEPTLPVEQEAKKTKVEEPETTQKQGKSESETTTITTGQGEEHEAKITEKGHIFFFYRPKVGLEDVKGIDDVQRFYVVLSPFEKGSKKRLLILAKKKLPDTAPEHKKTRNKFWSFVDKVSTDPKEISEALKEETYTTKTKGETHVAAARLCAEGYYSIVLHDNKHTHLVYVLEVPHKIGEVQKAFNIADEGSFVITVKNPFGPGKDKGLAKKAEFPDKLKSILQDYSFVPANPVELLDYENAEIVLIGVHEDITHEFGSVGEQIEKEEQKDIKKLKNKEKIFKELKLSKEQHPMEPLSGHWK